MAVCAIFPAMVLSEQQTNKMDIYAGHFAREGNNESASKTTNHNIYMKFFKNQWIVTLFVPHPYASTVEPALITKALEEAKKQASNSAYIRSKFGQLKERSIATIEKYGYVEDRLMFECNSLSPCSVKPKDGYLELIKPGLINEHIIKYNHVVDY